MPNTATACLGDPQDLLNAGAQHAKELSLLSRYHSVMLFGGGMVLSVLIVVAACLVLYNAVNAAVSRLQAELMAHHSIVTMDIEGKQTAMRRGVIHAELLWQARPAPSRATWQAFRAGQGRARLQASPGLSPILAAADLAAGSSMDDYARYLGMLELQAYTATASEQERKSPLMAYGYSPDLRFVGLLPAPRAEYAELLRRAGVPDTAGLIGRLSYDLAALSNAAVAAQWASTRRILWQPPGVNPLSGENVLKLVQPAFDGLDPFMIFVSDYPVSALAARLDDIPTGTAVALVDGGGRVLLDVDRTGAPRAEPIRAALAAGSWRQPAHEARTHFQDGVFSLSEPLLDTGWTLVYAYPWRTIVGSILPSLALYLTVTILLLGTLWALLLWFNRKALIPVYRRSQHVFESEHMNRSIIATAQFGVGLVSCASGEVLLQNAMMERYAARAAAGVSLPALLRDCHAGGDPKAWVQRDREVLLRLDDGRECELLVNIVKTRYHGDDVLLCSFADATARKDIEKKREDARVAAVEAARAKSVFLATMSHEIRTPLNLLLGHLELLDRDQAGGRQDGRLRTVREASRALVDIINDILDVSRMESGQMTVERIPFDLERLIAEAVAMFEPAAQAKGLRLSSTTDPALARRYAGDPTRIRQILVNLVGNAVKFTDDGEVAIAVTAALGGAGDAAVLIQVRDTGIGMTPEQAAQAFTLYAQSDSSIARRFGGSGLGLPISKKLAEMMNGTLSVSCPPGGGSVFSMTLPLQPCHDAACAEPQPGGVPTAGAEPAQAPTLAGVTPDIRILVVDDHPANRALILDQLAALGCPADAAESATAAMRCLRSRRYDLVMTDLSMPEISGYALAHYLRGQEARLPIIAITAHADPEELRPGGLAAFDAVLQKPLSLRSLQGAIQQYLPRARPWPQQTQEDPALRPPEPGLLAAMEASLSNSLAVIRQALAGADFQQVREQCHSMRGAFAMMRKTDVAQRCLDLERLAAARNRRMLEAGLPELEALARAALSPAIL
ncbi:ATP-binding protein [Achromobacter anxifer]|uniref:ATP-binding protein n=1 Tax=Achromobacter anxifer TaxID=1287737 RepID=UPI0023F8B67F|nr:ATP-binding protein [Achromobacter anxifer]MDF8365213.1 ATP-binding protein [Achromobacter anxifer]